MEAQADTTMYNDTGLDDTSVNPVASSSAEAATYGDGLAPELFPPAGGVPGLNEAANPFPGQDAADAVAHAMDELSVPPPLAGDASNPQPEREQDVQQSKDGMDDDDEDAGDDLFGDADDDDDEAMQEQPEPEQAEAEPEQEYDADGNPLTAEEAAQRRRLEYEEEDVGSGDDGAGEEHRQQDITTATVPLVNVPVPASGKVWHTRLPNFLQIASNPFVQDKWEPEDAAEVEDEPSQSQSQGGEEGKPARSRGGLPDENVIRWRWTKDELNQVVKQSNARIVRWSDGTHSLQLGAELFDLTISLDHSAVLTASGSKLPVPPTLNPPTSLTSSTLDNARSHGLTYLTSRHQYSPGIFEAQASIYGTIGMRPATLASQTHKRLASTIASRHARAAQGRATKAITIDEDPERARLEREKKAAEKARKAQKEARKAAGAKRGGGGGRRGGAKKATVVEGLDLSGSEDEDGEGWNEDRRSQPKRGRGGALSRSYSDDDDDGFVAGSDEDMAMSGSDREEIEEAEEAAEREERRRKDRSSKQQRRDASSDDEADQAAATDSQAAAAPRRRLVVESDEE
ncbi:hypothetical protein JCM10207_006952 [Rhodosporidiobolus poonsookiae]